jgi:hypothetical protein
MGVSLKVWLDIECAKSEEHPKEVVNECGLSQFEDKSNDLALKRR